MESRERQAREHMAHSRLAALVISPRRHRWLADQCPSPSSPLVSSPTIHAFLLSSSASDPLAPTGPFPSRPCTVSDSVSTAFPFPCVAATRPVPVARPAGSAARVWKAIPPTASPLQVRACLRSCLRARCPSLQCPRGHNPRRFGPASRPLAHAHLSPGAATTSPKRRGRLCGPQ